MGPCFLYTSVVCLKLERKFDKLMNILKTKMVILKLK